MRRDTRRPAAALSAAILVAICAGAAAQAPKSTKDGVYTAEQAGRGDKVYAEQCASCHGDDLSGGGFAPALAKDSFLSAYANEKLESLSSRIKETMPADKPGTLSAEANADLLAYILKVNGFPAGTQSLPTDTAALQQITIVKP